MSKKTFTLIILTLIGILTFCIWFFFFKTPTGDGPKPITDPNLFPFGEGSNQPSVPVVKPVATSSNPNNLSSVPPLRIPKLRQVSKVPTTGATIQNATTSTIIRFIERATGHIYETTTDSLDTKQISVTTIPKLQKAQWGGSLDELVIQYIKDEGETIKTFYGKIATSSTLSGVFFEDGLENINILGNKAFYFSKNGSQTLGIQSNLDDTKKTALFSSSFGEWASTWNASSSILLFPKPSKEVLNLVYSLDTKTGNYVKVAGPIAGLYGVSNGDGSKILLTASENNTIATAVYNKKTSETKVISGIRTFAEKCVWGKKDMKTVYCAVPQTIPIGNYPDAWYEGSTHFKDSLWKINTETGETQELTDLTVEAGEEIDVADIQIDSKDTMLLFTNKNTETVWAYDVSY